MAEKERIDFCTICRKETEYVLKKRNIKKNIKDVEYMFNITIAICRECGEEMSIPGLIDRNIQEVDKQYRDYENIVSINDIENLMKIIDPKHDSLRIYYLGNNWKHKREQEQIPRANDGVIDAQSYMNRMILRKG